MRKLAHLEILEGIKKEREGLEGMEFRVMEGLCQVAGFARGSKSVAWFSRTGRGGGTFSGNKRWHKTWIENATTSGTPRNYAMEDRFIGMNSKESKLWISVWISVWIINIFRVISLNILPFSEYFYIQILIELNQNYKNYCE